MWARYKPHNYDTHEPHDGHMAIHTTGKWWAHYSSTQVQGARQ